MDSQVFFNVLCYSLGWFWAVCMGSAGHTLLASTGLFLLIIAQITYAKHVARESFYSDFILSLSVFLMAPFLEILFPALDLFRYTHHNGLLPPLWILLLYPLFFLQMNHSLKWLIGRPALAAVLGFIFAPLSYFGGSALGGLEFSSSPLVIFLGVGLGWSIFLAVFSLFTKHLNQAVKQTLQATKERGKIKLLYDGHCPLCSLEVNYLNKKNNGCVLFVDIADAYLPTENNQISYAQAMSQIHGIDANGKTLLGIDAFAAAYEHCGLFLPAILFRTPGWRQCLNFFYRLFAKYRLTITGR